MPIQLGLFGERPQPQKKETNLLVEPICDPPDWEDANFARDFPHWPYTKDFYELDGPRFKAQYRLTLDPDDTV